MFSRKINLFEKILLPVGAVITIFGFYLLVQADNSGDPTQWTKFTSIFMWLLLTFSMIIAATIEDVKEELVLITREHVSEIKLLNELVHDQLLELKELRKDFSNITKKSKTSKSKK